MYANHLYVNTGDRGVTGAKAACRAAARYIAVLHEPAYLAKPFLDIYQAFSDLESSIVHELFRRNDNRLERSRSSQKKHLRKSAAVCLEVLVELRENRDRAAEQVARHVTNWAGIGEQDITPTTVRNWRDAERSGDTSERSEFEALRSYILKQDDPKALVQDLLRNGPPSTPKS